MRRLNVPVLLAMTVLSMACGDLLSLHALYTTHDQVFDSALEGRWERDDDRLLMQRVGADYTVTGNPQAMNAPAQREGRFPIVGSLIDHIFLVEQRQELSRGELTARRQ